MNYEIKTEQLQARPYAGVRSVVSQDQIANACAESFGKTWNWCEENGIEREGMPINVYHHVDHAAGQYDIQPAFFLAASADGAGDVTTSATTPGTVLTTTHTGPYEGLGEAWTAIFAHAEDNGLAPAGSPWEEYIDDPGAVAADALRTRLFLPVAGG